ncbi:MAG: DUF4278 domain-containing protein [Leptolyngbyaceae cyanobacterium HOT.MB2.61]|nr:DUF4278 domain-containing protein [Leptolyngbyaceae cyanobacterium HOT.MB2.61]
MKLTFLGQTYEATSTEMEANPVTVTGRYRGHLVKFSDAHAGPRSDMSLTYRGVRYVR